MAVIGFIGHHVDTYSHSFMEIPHPKLNFDNAAIVVAHPDDEILWFSSILKKVGRIVVCYLNVRSNPQWSVGRQRCLSEYPLKNIQNLEFDEAGGFDDRNWLDVEPVQYGIKIKKSKNAYAKYISNFHELQKSLNSILADYQNIFTHNPWGEYGNEEHIQVFRVVNKLKQSFKYNVWCPNYCSNKSISLMAKSILDDNYDYFSLKTDKVLGAKILDLYQQNNCWTWYNDWQWFEKESFIRVNPSSPGTYGNNFPVNMINVKVSFLEKKPTVYRKIRSALKAFLLPIQHKSGNRK